MAKTTIIGVRVDESRRGQFERAAKIAGKNISEWLRDLGIREVEVPDTVMLRVPGGVVETVQSDIDFRVLEMAAKAEAPVGRSVTEFLMNAAPKIPTGRAPDPGPIEECRVQDRRPWLPELIRIQGMYELSPGEGVEAYGELVSGMRLPAEYRGFKSESNQKAMAKRAAWLDANFPLSRER